MRSRNIKPGFYANEDLAECSVWARLIFPGLWMMADREGRLEYRPKKIKGKLLPFDNQDTEPLLKELAQFGFIEIYEIESQKYIQIIKFLEHQNPHHREAESTIAPPQSLGLLVHATNKKPQALHSLEEVEAQCLPEAYPPLEGGQAGLIPDSGFLIQKHTSPSPGDTHPIGFARFWQTWPQTDRKTAKAKCLEVWRKRKLEALADEIVRHVETLKPSKSWRDGYEPAPLTYLNQRRWEDGDNGGFPVDDQWAGAL